MLLSIQEAPRQACAQPPGAPLPLPTRMGRCGEGQCPCACLAARSHAAIPHACPCACHCTGHSDLERTAGRSHTLAGTHCHCTPAGDTHWHSTHLPGHKVQWLGMLHGTGGLRLVQWHGMHLPWHSGHKTGRPFRRPRPRHAPHSRSALSRSPHGPLALYAAHHTVHSHNPRR